MFGSVWRWPLRGVMRRGACIDGGVVQTSWVCTGHGRACFPLRRRSPAGCRRRCPSRAWSWARCWARAGTASCTAGSGAGSALRSRCRPLGCLASAVRSSSDEQLLSFVMVISMGYTGQCGGQSAEHPPGAAPPAVRALLLQTRAPAPLAVPVSCGGMRCRWSTTAPACARGAACPWRP